jgi:excisionase family DNA binding protein
MQVENNTNITNPEQVARGYKLLRVPRAASLCDVSTSQMYNLISRGEVKCVRLGRSIRVPEHELARLAAGGTEAA